jgi:hypothetical protein
MRYIHGESYGWFTLEFTAIYVLSRVYDYLTPMVRLVIVCRSLLSFGEWNGWIVMSSSESQRMP